MSLKDLHDAFTGAPLNPALGLHQCTTCKVYYHSGSFDVLRAENAGRCMVCGGNAFVAQTTRDTVAAQGRDQAPDAVTLSSYRSHFNRVVTFEGMVREVKTSQRGQDYAAMFEQTTWKKGLKLIFFRKSLADSGGAPFIKSLQGRHVRVRGLLVNHAIFGPQIIVTGRNMILDVR